MHRNTLVNLPSAEFWPAFFALSDKEKHHPYVEDLALLRAKNWHTCACCELKDSRRNSCPTMPQNESPLNRLLDHMGFEFFLEIESKHFDKAKDIYDKIQGLVAEENKLP